MHNDSTGPASQSQHAESARSPSREAPRWSRRALLFSPVLLVCTVAWLHRYSPPQGQAPRFLSSKESHSHQKPVTMSASAPPRTSSCSGRLKERILLGLPLDHCADLLGLRHAFSDYSLDPAAAVYAAASAQGATRTAKVYPPARTATAAEKAAFRPPNRLWPYAFNVLLALAIVLYALVRARIVFRSIVNHRITRGWYLRSKPASTDGSIRSPVATLPKTERSQPRPARRTPRVEAHLRGWYNAYLLPTVPFLDLTVGQCVVLVVYLACVFAATFAQANEQAKNPVRSGRIAYVLPALSQMGHVSKILQCLTHYLNDRVAQMPALFLLATKNNLLSVIVGKSYVKLNFVHRFAGRCITACSILHSGLFIKRERCR